HTLHRVPGPAVHAVFQRIFFASGEKVYGYLPVVPLVLRHYFRSMDGHTVIFRLPRHFIVKQVAVAVKQKGSVSLGRSVAHERRGGSVFSETARIPVARGGA